MKSICVLLILCLLFASCAGANEVIPVCPDLTPFTESGHVETEEVFALVDWMIFVRYNGRSYTRDFSEPMVIPEDQIGEMLGRVEHNPPSMVPVDYEEPDLLSFGYRIGAPFYEIKDGIPHTKLLFTMRIQRNITACSTPMICRTIPRLSARDSQSITRISLFGCMKHTMRFLTSMKNRFPTMTKRSSVITSSR